jgi:ubiquinone/menaquinone biosynthesis C-methylase UbiE
VVDDSLIFFRRTFTNTRSPQFLAGRYPDGLDAKVLNQTRKDMVYTARAHKALIQQEFTKQAPAYAVNPTITDPQRIKRLIQAIRPAPDARVLEVATGPGHVAMALARVCGEVIGFDLTQAQLAQAEKIRSRRRLANVRFEAGDAERTRFACGEFDVVVCRFAFHHFEHPRAVLAEMSRVCRLGGKVVVEDLIASEHPSRAAYLNHIERLRDPSHMRSLPLSELIAMFTGCRLEIEDLYFGCLTPEVETWMANAGTTSVRARRVRGLLLRDARDDLSAARPYRSNGQLHFLQRTATIIARKLRSGPKRALARL